MPQITVTLSKKTIFPQSSSTLLLQALSKNLSETLNKPETYVMASLILAETFCMAGKEADCCYIEISSIGPIVPNKALQITKDFCGILNDQINIDPSFISIRFTEQEGRLWGWNNQLFA